MTGEHSFMLKIRMGEIDNRTTVRNNFSNLADGSYLVIIKPANKRSLSQNNFIHGILFPEVLAALRNAGYDEIRTSEHAKQVCKTLFLKKEIINHDTGEVLTIIRDTSELTKSEMTEFIDSVIRWAANDLGHVIPLPGQQTAAF